MIVLKENASISIGILTLLVAGVAVYGISTVNTTIQDNQNPIKIPDYTAKLDSLNSQIATTQNNLNSLKSQIDSIQNQLSGLTDLKNNVADIQKKLTDLQNNNNQIQNIASAEKITFVLDKSIYSPGDTIKITAIGADPQKSVQVQLLDSSGFILVHKDAWSDSSGKIIYYLSLSNALPLGNYVIKLASDQSTDSQPVQIVASNTSQNTTSDSSGSYTFTVTTDKTSYNTGDLIEVSGTGQPDTTVTSIMKSPTGKQYSAATTVQSDGSYVIFYAPTEPYETGTWIISATDLAKTITLTVTIS